MNDDARLADIAAVGAFADMAAEQKAWTLVLNPAQVRALYATYSNITLRPPAERDRILDGLEAIARNEFGGRVERNMVTSLHVARRN